MFLFILHQITHEIVQLEKGQDQVQYICHVVNNKHCARNAHTHSHLHTKRPVKLIRLIINYTKKMGKLLII